MVDLLTLCFFLIAGRTCGKALGDFDRKVFVQTASVGNSIFLAVRIVLVSIGIYWFEEQITPMKYSGDILQNRVSAMMGIMAFTYIWELLGFGNWMRAKAWK